MQQSQAEDSGDTYRRKYRVMKRKLCLLVYEQEAFFEELKTAQRKLLKVARDKSFLLDRLVQYEHQSSVAAGTTESSSDSESTASSDSETKDVPSKKRKLGLGGYVAGHQTGSSVLTAGASGAGGRIPDQSAALQVKKRPLTSKVKPGGQKPVVSASTAVRWGEECSSLSHEEVERRLELKRINRPALMNIGVTPHSLPDDIFSHDNSNPLDSADGDFSLGAFSAGGSLRGNLDPSIAVKVEDDEDANLIIDMAD